MLRGRHPLPAFLAALGWLLAPAVTAQTSYSGHGAGSLSPDTIKKYAPPPLDPAVSRRIQNMLDVRSPGLGMVAPGGKRLFFGWSITGTPAVWRLDAPGSFPVQLTGGEDPTRLAGLFPDGRFLVVSRDRGGQEDPGLYLQPADGGPLRPIQHQPGSRAFYAFTTLDSRSVFFRANDRRPDSYALYRYDVATGAKELLFSEDGLWSIADRREEPEQVRLLLQRATGALSSELYEWGTKDRTLVPLLGQEEKTEYEAAYAAVPGELLVLTNKLGEFRRLYRWKAASGLQPVTPDAKMDVSGFEIDRPRRHVYYTLNDGGYTRLRVLDARTLAPLPFPEIRDADHVYPGTPSEDGRYVTVGVEGARAPRASYVFDWETKALTQWVLPAAPEVDLSKFAVARLESYPARDGTPIPMFARYPPACAPDAPPPGEPCPIVVEFHGGPEGQARPGFSPWAQLFVDAGFVFVEPNVRGSDGYGKSWLEADNGPKRLDVITDIDDCGKHLRQRFTRDGKAPKVAITGGSYGGYSTLVGMTIFAGTYDVGVSIVGISNLLTFLQNTAPYRRLLRATEYGDPEKDADALRQLSPVTYLDRVKAPLLLIQGVDDPRVPAGEAVQIQEALQSRGVSTALILMEGEGHGAARRNGQLIEAGHTLRFLEEHLGGGTR
jgi:dipeptidyl aminopeptidase/acylaminoacyl peptidase